MDRASANDRKWPAPVRDGLLFAAVVFSGAGGLIYQLAWTRWLASITSATHTGLARTIYCGMGCATVAAIIAVALQGRALEKLAVPPAEAMPTDTGVTWLGAACLAGFTGLGAEVLWTRLVSLIVPTTAYALAQVLAAVLLGIALGAGVAASLIRRTKTLATLQQAASLLLATGAAGLGGQLAGLNGRGATATASGRESGSRPRLKCVMPIPPPSATSPRR